MTSGSLSRVHVPHHSLRLSHPRASTRRLHARSQRFVLWRWRSTCRAQYSTWPLAGIRAEMRFGFGVGLAMGQATVGEIGYESGVEYTAIGMS